MTPEAAKHPEGADANMQQPEVGATQSERRELGKVVHPAVPSWSQQAVEKQVEPAFAVTPVEVGQLLSNAASTRTEISEGVSVPLIGDVARELAWLDKNPSQKTALITYLQHQQEAISLNRAYRTEQVAIQELTRDEAGVITEQSLPALPVEKSGLADKLAAARANRAEARKVMARKVNAIPRYLLKACNASRSPRMGATLLMLLRASPVDRTALLKDAAPQSVEQAQEAVQRTHDHQRTIDTKQANTALHTKLVLFLKRYQISLGLRDSRKSDLYFYPNKHTIQLVLKDPNLRRTIEENISYVFDNPHTSTLVAPAIENIKSVLAVAMRQQHQCRTSISATVHGITSPRAARPHIDAPLPFA